MTTFPQASFFDRDDVAFPGMHAFFKKASDEEREHAQKLMKFQNQRGGRVVLQPIMKPAQDHWGSPLLAARSALELEKSVNQSLLDLHKVADSHGDAQMCDFIESEFLTEQASQAGGVRLRTMPERIWYIVWVQLWSVSMKESIFQGHWICIFIRGTTFSRNPLPAVYGYN